MRCGVSPVSPGLMSSRLNIGETLQTITPGPHLLWYSSLMSAFDIPLCVLLRHELALSSEAGKKVTHNECSHSRSSQQAPSPHHSLPQHPLTTSTFNGPRTHSYSQARARWFIETKFFPPPVFNQLCTTYLRWCLLSPTEMFEKDIFLTAPLHRTIKDRISAKRGKFYCSWQTLSHSPWQWFSINQCRNKNQKFNKKLIRQISFYVLQT